MNKIRQKEEKFQKLSINRSEKVIKNLLLLGNLSNRTNYRYTEEQVKKLFKNIDEAYQLTKDRFNVEFKKQKLA